MLVLLMLLTSVVAPCLLAQATRERQNWQCLTGDRQAQYIAALKILATRTGGDSWSHPFDNSLKWYQQMHNGTGGGSACVHHDAQFLAWHRVALWYFEQAMKKALNDDTFVLPYWNWNELPTGKLFPKEFEENPDLKVTRATSHSSPIGFPSAKMKTLIDDNSKWTQFAGDFGALERQAHDGMHGWVGGSGPMSDDVTAAVDPLFWLFHAHIDHLFDRWQRHHSFPKPDNPSEDLGFSDKSRPAWTNDNTQHVETFGYTYNDGTCGRPSTAQASMRVATALDFTPTMAEVAVPKHRGGEPMIFDLTIPEQGFDTAELRLVGTDYPKDITYHVSVYLYPPGKKLATSDAAFRRRYAVEDFTVWAIHPASGHMHTPDVFVNATTELKYLAKSSPGSRWKVAVVVDSVATAGRSLTGAAAKSVRDQVHFDGIALALNRGEESQ
jgi:hypothetical protein